MRMLLMVLVVAVIAVVGWQWHSNTQLQQLIESRQYELQITRQQQARIQRDAVWWAQHQIDYQRLVDMGFVGADARVLWHQQLSALASIAGVRHAEFDIAAQTPHQPELHIGNRMLVDSMARWRGEVEHEGALVEVLTRLAQSEHGLLSARSCDLMHSQDSAPVAVNCEFVWQVLALQ
ncbi:MAG: hypothetical protein WC426_13840 [Sulfuriferula sp.]